CQRYVSAPFTF
nr:immunoglobulin light chain junction region [Macaca mulatta]